MTTKVKMRAPAATTLIDRFGWGVDVGLVVIATLTVLSLGGLPT